MKKLMIAAAVVAAGLGAQADIASANTVGYNTMGMLPNNYSMYGANFKSTGSASVLKLSDLQIEGGFTAGTGYQDGDEIEVWKAAGSKYYYYDGGDPDPEYGWPAGWYDKDDPSEPTTDGIAPGEGIWFLRVGAAAPLTFPGEVFTGEKSLPLLANNYSMVTMPYPANIKIGDLVVYGGATAGTGYQDGDELEVWKVSGSKYYYYDGGDPDPDTGWAAGWYDKDDPSEPTNDVIAPGESCWYLRVGDATTIDFDGL